MIGVWEFEYEKRDIRDKDIHPAAFPVNLAKKVISLYTHKGEVVLDPFSGVGTTLLACKELMRHGIGIDINKKFNRFAQERLRQNVINSYFQPKNNINIELICDDCRNVLEYIPLESIDLIFTSPPYANILNKERKNKSRKNRKKRLGVLDQYSENENDMGNLEFDDFFDQLSDLSSLLYQILKAGKRMVINMGDILPQGFVIPSLKKCVESNGFKMKNQIIWDKRNLVHNTSIFGYPSNYITLNSCYEYIVEFIKR